MSLDLGILMNLAGGLVSRTDPEAIALQVERAVRRKGGDPADVWLTVVDLGQRRLASLGHPSSAAPAVECETCETCSRLVLVSAQGVDLGGAAGGDK